MHHTKKKHVFIPSSGGAGVTCGLAEIVRALQHGSCGNSRPVSSVTGREYRVHGGRARADGVRHVLDGMVGPVRVRQDAARVRGEPAGLARCVVEVVAAKRIMR